MIKRYGRQTLMEDKLGLNTTLNGRLHLMEDYIRLKTPFDGRQPMMEVKL